MAQPYSEVIDIGGVELAVFGFYTPAKADNLRGDPDTWEQGYGADIEVVEVRHNGAVLECDTGNFAAAWRDQILDALEKE